MEDVSTSSKKKYTFNEQQFEDAWVKTWNGDEKKQIQNMFKKGAMPVSKIKGIFKDLCKAVSDGKNEQAFQIWRKVGTSGYLNRLMWAQGWDCGIPKNLGDKTVKKITFSPHKGDGLFKQSVIKEDGDATFEETFDEIISYWRSSDVDETKFPDEKLREFIDEFYINEYEDYTVVDLEDTMNGEYGTPEYAPEFEWDQLLFVYLNPDNTITVESDEGPETYEDWMEAKNYLIEQYESIFDTDEDEDEEDIEEQSVKKPVSKKKVIKEDSNPDVQDQADILNSFIEITEDEIDWEWAGDYEMDTDLNTCLFYNDADADAAWPLGDFATNEWDDEEDDYVYKDGEEVFREAYKYKFSYGSIFYLADELYDFVEKYGNDSDPEVSELKSMIDENQDILYTDYYEDDADKKFVDTAISYLEKLSGNFSDLDRVKIDVLKQIAAE